MTGNPLKERVLAIVSIIAQYVAEENRLPSSSDIVEELLASGFEAEEIDAAFLWMESFSSQQSDISDHPELTIPSQRIFTPQECQAISCEGRGFLTQIRGLGILDDASQEDIIQKAVQLDEDEITLADVKNLTALTLLTRSHNDWLREVDCFMADDWTRLYH
jgi:Smg protein